LRLISSERCISLLDGLVVRCCRRKRFLLLCCSEKRTKTLSGMIYRPSALGGGRWSVLSGPIRQMWVSKFRGHLCPFYGPLEMRATWELGDLRLVPGPSDRYIPEEVQHSIGGLPTAPYHMPMMHDRVMVNVTCLSLQRIVWSYATVRLQSFLESNLDFFISLGI